MLVTVQDPRTSEMAPVLKGFKALPVFACHQTEGRDLPARDLTPVEAPPFADLAKRLCVKVTYEPLPSDQLGPCSVDDDRIRLGTHDAQVLSHKLAYVPHARLKDPLRGGR